MTSYLLMNINDLGAMAMSSRVFEHLIFHRGASVLLLEKYCYRIRPQVFDIFYPSSDLDK